MSGKLVLRPHPCLGMHRHQQPSPRSSQSGSDSVGPLPPTPQPLTPQPPSPVNAVNDRLFWLTTSAEAGLREFHVRNAALGARVGSIEARLGSVEAAVVRRRARGLAAVSTLLAMLLVADEAADLIHCR